MLLLFPGGALPGGRSQFHIFWRVVCSFALLCGRKWTDGRRKQHYISLREDEIEGSISPCVPPGSEQHLVGWCWLLRVVVANMCTVYSRRAGDGVGSGGLADLDLSCEEVSSSCLGSLHTMFYCAVWNTQSYCLDRLVPQVCVKTYFLLRL